MILELIINLKKNFLKLLLLISINSFAGEYLFNNANELYANEKYEQAIILYDSIINQETESPEVYYNLGNCYYKLQDWANAIWHYEKSLKLI